MTHPSMSNLGSHIKQVLGVTAFATAGGAGDATEASGPSIDRSQAGVAFAANNGSHLAQSLSLNLIASATLAAGKKCTYVLTLQHGILGDGSDWVDLPDALQPGGKADSVVLTITDGGGGGTSTGNFAFNLNLESLNRFLRVQVTPDLNAANTDTSFMTVSVNLHGFRNVPVS